MMIDGDYCSQMASPMSVCQMITLFSQDNLNVTFR